MEISVLQYCSGLEPNAVSTLKKLKSLFSILKMQMVATQGKPHEIHFICFAQIWLYNAAGHTDAETMQHSQSIPVNWTPKL